MFDYAWLGIVVQFIDENKKDVKHVIESLDDIYNYEDEFFKAIDMYEHKEQDKSSRRLIKDNCSISKCIVSAAM